MLPDDPFARAFRDLVGRASEAVVVVGSRRQATVGDLARLADRLGESIARERLTPRSIVGFRFRNGPAFLSGLIACLESGLVPMLFDAAMPLAEQERALATCHATGSISCDDAWPTDADRIRVRASGTGRAAPIGSAVIKLSSGSTGEPRGILTPTRCLLAEDAALTATMGLTRDDRFLAMIPFSHSYGLSSLVLACLVRGARLVLADRAEGIGALEQARRAEVTVFPTVPAFLSAWLRLGSPPPIPASLRRIVTAGAPMWPENARRFRLRFGRPVHVLYGASECGGVTYDREGTAAEEGSVGSAVEGVGIELVDGSVRVSSPSVAAGYYPDPDPRLGGGSFLTGDTARWSGDRLVLTGRVDRFVKVKGNKVNPVEVERVIASLDGVEEVRVSGVVRESVGDERLQAVVRCSSENVTAADVIDWCRERLSDYKVPRIIRIVDQIPTDERGKPRDAP